MCVKLEQSEKANKYKVEKIEKLVFYRVFITNK